jgi:hypothetical protein
MAVLSFDIMSFSWSDDTSSVLYIEEVMIEGIIMGSATPLVQHEFTGTEDGWTFAGPIPGFDEPMSASGGTSLGLMANASQNSFSYWMSPDLTISDGTLYRARFEVGSLATDADLSVQFRLRTNQKGSWQAWDRIVSSFNQQAPPPTFIYYVIFDPTVTGTGDDLAVFSFDIMSFDWNDDATAWLFLESFALDELNQGSGLAR